MKKLRIQITREKENETVYANDRKLINAAFCQPEIVTNRNIRGSPWPKSPRLSIQKNKANEISDIKLKRLSGFDERSGSNYYLNDI